MFYMNFILVAMLSAACCYGQSSNDAAPDRPLQRFCVAAEGFFASGAGGGAVEAGYRINSRITAGVGVGYAAHSGDNYKGKVIPLFAGARANILNSALSPYVAVAVGAGIDAYTNTDTFSTKRGVTTTAVKHSAVWTYFNAAAGVYWQCTGRLAVTAAAAYNNIANAPGLTVGVALTL